MHMCDSRHKDMKVDEFGRNWNFSSNSNTMEVNILSFAPVIASTAKAQLMIHIYDLFTYLAWSHLSLDKRG